MTGQGRNSRTKNRAGRVAAIVLVGIIVFGVGIDAAHGCPCSSRGHCGPCTRAAEFFGKDSILIQGRDVPDPRGQNESLRMGLKGMPGATDYDDTLQMKWDDVTVCFKVDTATANDAPDLDNITAGTYVPVDDENDLKLANVTVVVTTSSVATIKNGKGDEIIYDADNKTISGYYSPGYAGDGKNMFYQAQYASPGTPVNQVSEGNITRYTELDGSNRSIRMLEMRSTTVQRIVYTYYTGTPVTRVRVTEVTFDSDDSGSNRGNARFLTTIYGYWGSGQGDNSGRLRYVVQPDGVRRFLKANGTVGGVGSGDIPTTSDIGNESDDDPLAACDLDDSTKATDALLLGYASEIYTAYDSSGRYTNVTRGCNSCSGAGDYIYYYNTCDFDPFPDPHTDDDYNQCVKYVYETTPSGLRKVRFYNKFGDVVFEVVQEMTGETVDKQWVTHSVYSATDGRLTETRPPSVCVVDTGKYVAPVTSGWTTSVTAGTTTTGVTRVYEWIDTNSNGLPERVSEKIKQGTAGTAYYVSTTRYGDGDAAPERVVWKTYEYSSAVGEWDDSSALIATSSYIFFDNNWAKEVLTRTVTHPTVTTDNHGSGSPTSVTYHYAQNQSYALYYVDWIKHEDGSLSYTEQDIDGNVVLSIRDVKTDGDGYIDGETSPTIRSPEAPSRWVNTSGSNLKTRYTYDDYGRVDTVTDPDGIVSKTCYMSNYDGNLGETTHLVTLYTPYIEDVDDNDVLDNYDKLPLTITVTDLAGRVVVSATGKSDTATDGDLENDWDATASAGDGVDGSNEVDDTMAAFDHNGDGSLFSRSVNVYDDNGLMTYSLQMTDADDTAADQYQTAYGYDDDTGRQIWQKSPAAVYDYTVYDQRGRVRTTWRGTVVTGATQADPQNGDSDLEKISETFYDQSAPGTGSSGVGDGNVTEARSFYGTGANDNLKTLYSYDYRNRMEQARQPNGVTTLHTFDHMGRTTQTDVYADGDSDWTIDTTPAEDYELRARTKTEYDEGGQVFKSTQYEVVDSDPSDDDTLVTKYWYDEVGRTMKVENPAGMFVKTVYDGAGRVVNSYSCHDTDGDAEDGGAYEGAGTITDDTVITVTVNVYLKARQTETKVGTTTGNAVAVSKLWYDEDYDNTNGDGDNMLPYVTAAEYVKSANTVIVLDNTTFTHDSAGRRDGVKPNIGPWTKTAYDDLGRVTGTYRYVYNSATDLVAQSKREYNSSGQLQYVRVYPVTDPQEGNGVASPNYIETEYFYDGLGRVCKVTNTGGGFTKTAYDLAGRVTNRYACSDEGTLLTGAEAGTDHLNVTNDIVLTETVYYYDSTTGQVYLTSTFDRNDDETAKQHALSTSWDPDDSQRTYAATWFDDLGRVSKHVFYGNNGGTTDDVIDGKTDDFDGDSHGYADPNLNLATGTTDYILTQYTYDGFGRRDEVIDNANITTKFFYDLVGRRSHVAENHDDFDPDYESTTTGDADDHDLDRVTKFTYDGPTNRLEKQIALDISGDGTTTPDENQETEYAYSDGTDTYCKVPRKDLLITTTHPDDDTVSFKYNADGTLREFTDQMGTVHTYLYDSLGRLTHDWVSTIVDTDVVDDSVKAIYRTYNDHRWLEKVTSYTTYAGTVVNDVAFTYDDLGRVEESEQEHSGAVGTSPSVQYTYDMTASGNVITHGGRLTQVTYPGPTSRRGVYYHYTDTDSTDSTNWTVDEKIDNAMSRVRTIASAALTGTDIADSAIHARFAYMGSGRITAEKHPAVTGGLDLTYGTGGTYGGFDQFGRVKDQKWQNGTPTVKDQFKYAYDAAGSRISREVAPDGDNPSGLDEYYLNDGLHRLLKMNRGNLAGGTITDANAALSHAWASWASDHWATELDAVGNWKKFKIDDDGGGEDDDDWSLIQSRKHNVVNEIDDDDDHTNDPDASITASPGTNWIDPKYDANGNMISGPMPGDEGATEHHYVYDAWNRLKVVYIDGDDDDVWDDGAPDTLVAEYEYDGLHRRVRKTVEGESALDYYYNTNWQVVEIHEGDDKVYPLKQYVWSPRYIDAPVLRIYDEGTDGEDIETLYYCNDANMNVTALIDTSGAVVERYRYDPYGAVTVLDPNYTDDEGNASDVDNEILYAGYRHDPETGLFHVRRRPYHPTVGRWLTRDPLDYVDGMNLYEYVGSGPTMRLDPMGLGAKKPDVRIVFQRLKTDDVAKFVEKAVKANDPSHRIDVGALKKTITLHEAGDIKGAKILAAGTWGATFAYRYVLLDGCTEVVQLVYETSVFVDTLPGAKLSKAGVLPMTPKPVGPVAPSDGTEMRRAVLESFMADEVRDGVTWTKVDQHLILLPNPIGGKVRRKVEVSKLILFCCGSCSLKATTTRKNKGGREVFREYREWAPQIVHYLAFGKLVFSAWNREVKCKGPTHWVRMNWTWTDGTLGKVQLREMPKTTKDTLDAHVKKIGKGSKGP